MTETGSVYGQALYSLAREEQLGSTILSQLEVLQCSFREEADFLKLLSSPSLTKQERCGILEESFRGKLHDYLLNFLKILTEKNEIRQFFNCCEAYEACFNADNGILKVTAVTAVDMTDAQKETLTKKINQLTGKQVRLLFRIDPAVLGGIRLNYDGQRLDDTVSHRLDAIRELLRREVRYGIKT